MKIPGRPESVGPVNVELKRYGTQVEKMGFVTQNTMDKITSLATFLSLLYLKNWCTVITDVPIQYLELSKKVERQLLFKIFSQKSEKFVFRCK